MTLEQMVADDIYPRKFPLFYPGIAFASIPLKINRNFVQTSTLQLYVCLSVAMTWMKFPAGQYLNHDRACRAEQAVKKYASSSSFNVPSVSQSAIQLDKSINS